MTPRRSRIAALAVVAALLVAACGDDDADTTTSDATTADTVADTVAETTSTTAGPADETTTTVEQTTTTRPDGADQLIEVRVAGDAVENGGRHDVSVGDTVAIVVTSDTADEIHVHGYDIYADIGPAAPTTVLIEATISGVWEVELHDSGLVLLELAVS